MACAAFSADALRRVGAALQAMADPDFAIDPTDPRFTRLKRPEDVLKAVQTKTRKGARPRSDAAGGDAGATGDAAKPSAAAGVAALASSLKRKAKAQKVRAGQTVGKRVKAAV